jgi:hypothetical protein
MNDEFDPIEGELHSLRPREVSSKLLQQIRRDLAGKSLQAPGFRWRWLMAPVGALAAALLLLHFFGRGHVQKEIPSRVIADVPAAIQPTEMPTLWAYEQALSDSPETFDSLFEKRALKSAPAGGASPPPRAFAWTFQDVSSWIGEF